MTPLRPRTLSLLLVAGVLAAPATGQAEPPASPYLRALQRAVAEAQARAIQDLDVWEDHSSWDSAWEVRTEHFRVRTTRSYGEGMQIALGLENMLEHFQQALGTGFAPQEPLPVFLLPDRAAYNQFGEANGAEHSSFYGSFYADQHADQPVAVAWEANPVWLRMQITHSVVHQYLDRAFSGSPPAWVDEGLAAYFSIYWAYPWAVTELERLKGDGELLPLSRLLSDPLPSYTQKTNTRFLQLGMLFYYLLRFRDDTRTTLPREAEQRAPFRDYLTAVLQGRDPSSLPVHSLLQDTGTLEKEFLAYQFPRQ